MPGYIVSTVEICGFRGIVDKQEIAFGSPITLFYGPNRNGKSSIINAIEWCLFGPDVAAIKYGDIRERDAWEVKNLKAPKCYVRCVFDGQDGSTVVATRTYKTPRTSEFSYETSGGLAGSEATALQALLRISPDDFISSVHLHPEVIRTLLTDRPKDRQEAVDRLLGLSEMRELVDAFAAAKPSEWTTLLDREISALDERLSTALAEKQKLIESESTELTTSGNQTGTFTAEGASEFARHIANDIESFCQKYHLSSPSFPALSALTDVQTLKAMLPNTVKSLRDAHPILSDQGKHLSRKNSLEGLRDSYATQAGEVAVAEQNLQAYDEKRSVTQLDQAVANLQEQVTKIDEEVDAIARNGNVLMSALRYFEERAESEILSYPLCGQRSQSAVDWRTHISNELEQQQLAPLKARKEEVVKECAVLQKTKADMTALHNKIVTERARAQKIVGSIEKAVGRQIAPGDDPVAIINQVISVIQTTLSTLENQVQEINGEFEGFQRNILDLERFYRIGKAQQELQRIESVDSNPSYLELRSFRVECEQYAEDVDLLVEGLKSAVRTEATARLTAAQNDISNTFKQLTDRPDFPGLNVALIGDGYAIELVGASSSTRALPLLNHADLNCAAIAIFLSLAANAQISHQLGFIVLDDPSQSMDRDCKRKLCHVLTSVCDMRQVIIATADDELRSDVLGMTKNKKSYIVKAWTPTTGPTIESAVPAHAV